MATETITTNTTTTIDVPAGEHLLEIYGTWDSASANVRHAGSAASFDGLSAVTADLDPAKVIITGGESVEVVTTGGGGSLSVTVRVNPIVRRV